VAREGESLISGAIKPRGHSRRRRDQSHSEVYKSSDEEPRKYCPYIFGHPRGESNCRRGGVACDVLRLPHFCSKSPAYAASESKVQAVKEMITLRIEYKPPDKYIESLVVVGQTAQQMLSRREKQE
jgi:hypothetical protein